MKHISSHILQKKNDDRKTERGELMKYFLDQINPGRVRDGLPKVNMGRMGKMLQQIPTKDLYYLKRVCDDSQNFSKKFWWEINPKKHVKPDGTPLPQEKIKYTKGGFQKF